ncbi:hypothetical protein ACHWQZ_G014982 [Mnemiopsis leidyi]
MLDFSFKISERTRRGKVLKSLLSDDNIPNASQAKILLSNTCKTCQEDVNDPQNVIHCYQCNEKYHVPCLQHTLPSDHIKIFASNPCLWWFCATCVSTAQITKSHHVPEKSSQQDMQVDLMKCVSDNVAEQFSSFKIDIMSRMDTIIEEKFSKIAASQHTTDPFNAINQDKASDKSYSSLFLDSSKNPKSANDESVSQTMQEPLTHNSSIVPEFLVLSPNENVSSSVNMEKMGCVKKLVEKKLKNCQVVSINCNEKSKKVSIGFPNCDVRDKAAALINFDKSLDSLGYQSQNARKMLPKVTLHGVSSDILKDIDLEGVAHNDDQKVRDLEKHEIVMKILEKNPLIKELYDNGHTLTVVYLKRVSRKSNGQDFTELTIGIKVSPRIHQVIFGQQQGAIYIGFRRHNVNDRFFIKTCYHCQMVGHTSSECKDAKLGKEPICMYCMGKHRSSNCPNKKKTEVHVCARCLASPHGRDAENAKTHNAGCMECPILVRESARLAANTDFKSKNAKFAEIHDLGYDVISAPRKGRGGGVAFLYNPNILNPVRNDVKKYSSFEVIECIIKSANASIRLCVIYRSTRNKEKYEETKVSKFMTDFEDYLDNLVTKSGSPIICGDFNFHVEDPYDASAQKFIDLYRSKGFAQHVSAPTHISGSTLDLVLTLESVVDPIALQQIVCEPNTGTASDHFLVSFNIPITLNCSNSRTYEEKEVREMGKIDINSFREDLFFSKLNQGNYESVDQAVQLYSDVVGAVLEKHAPLISKKFTTQKSDFWNDKCQAAVRERRRAKRALVKAKTKISIGENIDMEELENLKINHGEKSIDAEIVINRARTDFYNKQLASLKGDSKGTYKVINKLLDKEYGSNKAPNGDEEEVANRLKTFFDVKVRTIYSNIKNNMTCSPESKEAVGTAADCTLDCFREISVQELEDLIRNLPNKSSPLDTIPLWLFKHCLPELLPIVHYIVNESLKEGYFPAALKEASIRPGLKKPTLDVDELKNYRPISNLTYLSKILEKAVHSQLCSYVDSNNLFSNYQSGYRKFHSCETAVTKIHNDVLMMIDKKENVLLLLLDLSAAFDTINHDLLLKKLTRTYGIRKTAIKCESSQLQNLETL